MIKFANSKFLFAIIGLKLTRRSKQDKLMKHKIEGLIAYLPPWNDIAGTRKGLSSAQ